MKPVSYTHLANSINGVSKLHSEIIKESVFHDYYLFKPQAFKNVTNGIAYRLSLIHICLMDRPLRA